MKGNRTTRCAAAVVILFLLTVAALAQPRYKVIDFSKLNDVVTQVNRIVRDGRGMMWFATDNGLYRYDGYEFQSFKSSSGDGINMLSNNINYLYASSEGGVWCLVSKRAFLFDTRSYRYIDVMKPYETQHGVSYQINKLRTLPCGTTWLFTDDGKILVLEDARPDQSARPVATYNPNGNVTAICDAKERSWLLTDKHTYIYDNGKMTGFNQSFRKILAAGQQVWLLSGDGNLFRFDEGSRRIRRWTHKELNAPIEGYSLLADGRLALFTPSGLQLVSADGKTLTATPVTRLVQKIMDDGNGHLWIFGKEGWLSIADKDCRKVTDIGGFHAEKCDIMRDNHGSVWVFSDQNVAYYSQAGHPETLVRYDGDKLMGDINNTINDGQGGYWFIHKHHAYRLTFESPHYTLLPLYQADQVRCVVKDQQNRLLVATRYDESVAVFSVAGQRLGWLGRDGRIHKDYVSFGAAVYSGYRDADGNLWLGSKSHGLFRLRMTADGSFRVNQYVKDDTNPHRSVSDNEIYGFLADQRHRLWIATHKGGLCCITDTRQDTPRFVDARNGLPGWTLGLNASVRVLLATPTGHLLAGTRAGLAVADINTSDVSAITFKSHQREADRKESLSSNSITDMVRTADGRIFISTSDGGINELLSANPAAERLDFRHYNRTTGFPIDIALAMVEYGGALWTVAPNQLVEMQMEKSQNPNVNAFLLRENPRFASCKPVSLDGGRWVFGSNGGALMVNLDELKSGSFVPPLVVTGISKENGAVDYAAGRSDTITLAPTERDLTIWFSALDYENTELVAYAYRLDNSAAWTYIGHNNSITLARMQPGTYKLSVRSTDSNGLWCDNERMLTIIVKPTFWQTPWAALLVLLVLGAIAAIVTYTLLYIRRIKRQQRETMEAYLSLLSENNSKSQPDETEEKSVVQEPAPVVLPAGSEEDEELMKRLMAFIETRLGDSDVTVDDMASAVAVSRSGLHRKVKHLMGTSPMEFLREARIRKATLLLTNTGKSISEIAYGCGFSDPKYFSKCFKATTGKTPSEFKSDLMAAQRKSQ